MVRFMGFWREGERGDGRRVPPLLRTVSVVRWIWRGVGRTLGGLFGVEGFHFRHCAG